MDLSQVFKTPPRAPLSDRLPAEDLARIRHTLALQGLNLLAGQQADLNLARLRAMYEPYIFALASYLLLPLPPWIPLKKGKDNWQTTSWAETSRASRAGRASGEQDHF